MWPIIAGALGGLFNWFDQGNQRQQARENIENQQRANMEMAKYSYSRDLEQWNRGNVYNSPQAQMERLKAAGLNPNLVYGSGSAAGSSAGQLPKFQAPTVDYSHVPPFQPGAAIGGAISQFQDYIVKNAQVDNLREQFKTRQAERNVLDAPYYQEVHGPGLDLGLVKTTRRKEKYDSQFDLRRQQELQRGGLYPSQLEFQKERIRSQDLANERLVEQTRNIKLQNEFFAEKAIMSLFGGAAGAMRGVGAMFRGGKGALGKGTLGGAANAEKRFRALEMGSYYGSQRYK